MKILHIITGLTNGGAETVLYRLCTYDSKYNHTVVSLTNASKYGPLLKQAGIDVHYLNMPSGRITASGVYKLFKIIRRIKPDIVQTWMYHADLIGGVLARIAGIKNIVWNIRHTMLEPEHSKYSTIVVAKICAKLSKQIPVKIICCAEKALEVHQAIGFDKTKMIVIANGYDLSSLRVLPNAKLQLEKELNDPSPLIGMVGRFDPLKDHIGLVEAFAIVKKINVPHKLVLVGKNINNSNSSLTKKIKALGLNEQVILLDQRNDIPNIMNSLDLYVLSSLSEAFPNVLAEAMACATPCVTTDVGDAAFIVGDTGWVVPPNDPQALADAILLALDEQQTIPTAWLERKAACRARVVNNFSIETMINKYHQVWAEVKTS